MEANTLYGFDATQQDELSFRKGDILKVRSKEDQGWFQAELNGRVGFIPSTYIEMEPHDWYKGNWTRHAAEEFLMKPGKSDGDFVIRDCQTDKTQFSLSVFHGGKPQHFKIMSKEGTYYLWPDRTFNSINKLIEYYRHVSVAREPNTKIFLRDNLQEEFEAMYDFTPDSPEELPFRKGNRIRIIDKTDPNWWTGEVVGCPGQKGLLPSNYIKKAKS